MDLISDNYALMDWFDYSRLSDGFMMQESIDRIEARWGSVGAFAAVLEAFKATENLNNVTARDINAFGDALREKGFQIVPIQNGISPSH